nr:AfsA-related hotdog domain-containing protein [Streptomyces sp. SLBN-31]
MSVSTYRTTRVIPGLTQPAGPGAPTGGAPVFQPLTSTVPKELVHRASVAEVMLTDWARRSEDHFTLAAQWPRGHSFFTTIDGCHDPSSPPKRSARPACSWPTPNTASPSATASWSAT